MIYDGLLRGDNSKESLDLRAKYLQEIQVNDQEIKKRGQMSPLHYVTKRFRHKCREISHIRWKCSEIKESELNLIKFFVKNDIKVESD